MSTNTNKLTISGFAEMARSVQTYVSGQLENISFSGLQDTPSGYLGHSGNYMIVNDNESGIHFTGIEKIASDLTDYGFSAGETTFTGLSDTPSDFTAGKYLRVNDAGDALEYVDIEGGSGGGSISPDNLYQTYLDKSSNVTVFTKVNSPMSPHSTVNVFEYRDSNPIYIYGGNFQSSYATNPKITIDDVLVTNIEGLIVGQDQHDSDISVITIPPIYATGHVQIQWHNSSASAQEYGGLLHYATGHDIQTIDVQGGGAGGGGGGSSTFAGLNDTPTDYLGHSGDYLVVNDGERGIHFTGIEKIAADLTDYGFSAGETTFTGLSDTPSDFTAGKYLRVNDAGDALEYVDIEGGSSGGGDGNVEFSKANFTSTSYLRHDQYNKFSVDTNNFHAGSKDWSYNSTSDGVVGLRPPEDGYYDIFGSVSDDRSNATEWRKTTQQILRLSKKNISDGTTTVITSKGNAKYTELNGSLTLDLNETNVYLTTDEYIYVDCWIYNSIYTTTNFPISPYSHLSLTKVGGGGSSGTGLGVIGYGAVNGGTIPTFAHKSNNVQSVTRSAAGRYTITLNTALTNYNIQVNTRGSAIASAFIINKSNNSFDIVTRRLDHANASIEDVDASFDFTLVNEDAIIGGGGGSSTFAGLNDTPTDYLGHSGDYLVVNDGESGIHFTGIEKIAADLTDYGFSAGETTFTGLSDTPSDFTAGKYLRVNDAGDALEYVDIEGVSSVGSASIIFSASLDSMSSVPENWGASSKIPYSPNLDTYSAWDSTNNYWVAPKDMTVITYSKNLFTSNNRSVFAEISSSEGGVHAYQSHEKSASSNSHAYLNCSAIISLTAGEQLFNGIVMQGGGTTAGSQQFVIAELGSGGAGGGGNYEFCKAYFAVNQSSPGNVAAVSPIDLNSSSLETQSQDWTFLSPVYNKIGIKIPTDGLYNIIGEGLIDLSDSSTRSDWQANVVNHSLEVRDENGNRLAFSHNNKQAGNGDSIKADFYVANIYLTAGTILTVHSAHFREGGAGSYVYDDGISYLNVEKAGAGGGSGGGSIVFDGNNTSQTLSQGQLTTINVSTSKDTYSAYTNGVWRAPHAMDVIVSSATVLAYESDGKLQGAYANIMDADTNLTLGGVTSDSRISQSNGAIYLNASTIVSLTANQGIKYSVVYYGGDSTHPTTFNKLTIAELGGGGAGSASSTGGDPQFCNVAGLSSTQNISHNTELKINFDGDLSTGSQNWRTYNTDLSANVIEPGEAGYYNIHAGTRISGITSDSSMVDVQFAIIYIKKYNKTSQTSTTILEKYIGKTQGGGWILLEPHVTQHNYYLAADEVLYASVIIWKQQNTGLTEQKLSSNSQSTFFQVERSFIGGSGSNISAVNKIQENIDNIPLIGSGVQIPDAILIKDINATTTNGYDNLMQLDFAGWSNAYDANGDITSQHFYYENNNYVSKRWYIRFNSTDGSYIFNSQDQHVKKEFNSIQEYISNDRALYFGGGGGSLSTSSNTQDLTEQISQTIVNDDLIIVDTDYSFQTKHLNGTIASDGGIADLEFTNLTIGDTYRLSSTVSINSDGTASDKIKVNYYHDGNKIAAVYSDGVSQSVNTSILFNATSNSLLVSGENLDANNYIEGSPNEITFTQIEKISNNLIAPEIIAVTDGSTQTFDGATMADNNYIKIEGDNVSATIQIDGDSFAVAQSGEQMIWDQGGVGETTLNLGESINITLSNGRVIEIKFYRSGSLYFAINKKLEPTIQSSPTPTPTAKITVTPTPSITPTTTPTVTASITPTPSITPTATPTPSVSAGVTGEYFDRFNSNEEMFLPITLE